MAAICISSRNPDDISNVFRVDAGSADEHQVTDVDTGVSGLTPTSPSLSVAGATHRCWPTPFYRRGRYRIAILDGPASSEASRATDAR